MKNKNAQDNILRIIVLFIFPFFKCNLFTLAICRRTYSYMLLEIFAKEALVWEVHLFCYLFYVLVGIPK